MNLINVRNNIHRESEVIKLMWSARDLGLKGDTFVVTFLDMMITEQVFSKVEGYR